MLYCLYRNTDAVVCLTVKHVMTMHKRSRRKEVLPVTKVVSTVWTVLTASKLGGPLVVWGAVTVAFRPLSSSTQLQVLRTSVAVVASLSASRTCQSRVRLSSHYTEPYSLRAYTATLQQSGFIIRALWRQPTKSTVCINLFVHYTRVCFAVVV